MLHATQRIFPTCATRPPSGAQSRRSTAGASLAPGSRAACITVAVYCDPRRCQCTRLRAPAAAVRTVRHKELIGDAARFAPCATWHATRHVALSCRQQEIIGDNVDFGDANGTVPRLNSVWRPFTARDSSSSHLFVCLRSSCPPRISRTVIVLMVRGRDRPLEMRHAPRLARGRRQAALVP